MKLVSFHGGSYNYITKEEEFGKRQHHLCVYLGGKEDHLSQQETK